MTLRFLSSFLIATTLITNAALATENPTASTASPVADAPTDISKSTTSNTTTNTESTPQQATDATANATKNPGTPHEMLKNSPKSVRAELKLKQTAGKLNAQILVRQTENAAGKIQVKWEAPKQSACQNSQLTLPYSNKQFHTRAYRTVEACQGEWTISILDENDNVISTDHFTVEKRIQTDIAKTEPAKTESTPKSTSLTENSKAVEVAAKKVAETQTKENVESKTAMTMTKAAVPSSKL